MNCVSLKKDFNKANLELLWRFENMLFEDLIDFSKRKSSDRQSQIKKLKDKNLELAQVSYAECLFIRGKATGDEAEASDSLAMLYNLAKDSNIVANHLVAYYIVTAGDFESFGAGVDTLNDSIFYYQQVLALIELRPSYGSPMDGYSDWEDDLQMELEFHLVIPFLYLNKCLAGGIGSYNQKLLNSVSYKGDRDLKTYSEYSEFTIDSIKKRVSGEESVLRKCQEAVNEVGKACFCKY